MKRALATFLGPMALLAAGWLWQYLGYRLAFGGSSPEYGFYQRPSGHSLERWLFDGPVTVVVSGLLIFAFVAGRSLYRQGHRVLVALYVLECLICACVFVVPGVWFIDVPGRGEFLI